MSSEDSVYLTLVLHPLGGLSSKPSTLEWLTSVAHIALSTALAQTDLDVPIHHPISHITAPTNPFSPKGAGAGGTAARFGLDSNTSTLS